MIRRLCRPVNLLRGFAAVNAAYAIFLAFMGLGMYFVYQLLIAMLFFCWSIEVARVDTLRRRNDRLQFDLEMARRSRAEGSR
jgi:hypothetical protein